MKRHINFILISILLSTLIGSVSCKKYEDGGNSFRLEKKLQEKSWELSHIIEGEFSNDINYTKLKSWNSIYLDENNDFYINTNKVGTYTIKDKTALRVKIADTTYNFINSSTSDDGIYLEINLLKSKKFTMLYPPSNTYMNYENN